MGLMNAAQKTADSAFNFEHPMKGDSSTMSENINSTAQFATTARGILTRVGNAVAGIDKATGKVEEVIREACSNLNNGDGDAVYAWQFAKDANGEPFATVDAWLVAVYGKGTTAARRAMRDDVIMSGHRAGLKVRDIAELAGCSIGTVSNVVKAATAPESGDGDGDGDGDGGKPETVKRPTPKALVAMLDVTNGTATNGDAWSDDDRAAVIAAVERLAIRMGMTAARRADSDAA